MVRSANNMIKIMKGQIGYCEKETHDNLDDFTANAGNGNHTKYARDLYKAGYYGGKNKCGYAWCDVTFDWGMFQLCDKDAEEAQRRTFQTGPYGAGCTMSAKYYKEAGRLFTENPQPGDQIFFGDFDHTGLISAIDDEFIYTIEGNSHNMVEPNKYYRNDPWINSFGRPDYEEDVEEEIPAPMPSIDNGYFEYVVESGDSWWYIADKYMGSGHKMNELAAFNKMSIDDIIHPDDVLRIPTRYGTFVHVVESGEGWWSIANKYMGNGNKMHELAAFNDCTIDTMLHPGNKVKIPGANSVPEYKMHTVKPGESWWSIADDMMGNGNKMHELAEYNGKTINTMLHPGNVLKIPNR